MPPERGHRDPDFARQAAPLSIYWNAVVDSTEPESADVDPELAAVVRRLHTTPSAPALSASQQDQIWRGLAAALAPAERPAPAPGPPVASNGRAVVPLMTPIAPTQSRRGWLVAQIATAALLLLTLVSGYVAFVRPHLAPGETLAPAIPAIDAVPTPVELAPGVTLDTTVLQATVETMPADVVDIGLYRFTLDPGAAEDPRLAGNVGRGPDLFTVEAGQATVTADGPVFLTRNIANGTSVASTVPPQTAVELLPGDQIYAPEGVSVQRRNEGAEVATLFGFSILSVSELPIQRTITNVGALPFKSVTLRPRIEPALAAVKQITLVPGASLPVRDLPGLELIAVSRGAIDLIYNETIGATAFAGSSEFTPENGGIADLGPTPDKAVLANTGTEPVTILAATVSAPAAAADQLDTARFPTGVTADGTRLRANVETMPDGVVDMVMDRFMLEPGAVENAGAPENRGVGPYLFVVESGQIIVDADRPVVLTRQVASGAETASEVPAGTRVVLDVGDQVLAPAGVAFRRRNEGTAPAILYEFKIATTSYSPSQPGVETGNCEACKSVTIRPAIAPAVLAVQQFTLAPGARLPARDLPGLQLVVVERGAAVLIYNEAVEVSAFAGSYEVTAGSFGFSDLGATPDKAVFTNEGTEPAVILAATITAPGSAADGEDAAAAIDPNEGATLLPDLDLALVAPAAAATNSTLLLHSTFDRLPDQAAAIGAERTTLEPGVVWRLGPPDNALVGPMAYGVEAGALTIEADGVIFVTRASATQATPIEPATAVTLDPGDRGFTPSGVASLWRNDGAVPVRVFNTIVYALAAGDPPPGVSHQALIGPSSVAAPRTPFTVDLRRLTLAAGEALAPADIVGLRGVYVSAGTLEVRVAAGPGAQAGAFPIPSDTGRAFGEAGADSVPANWTWRSAGSDPVSVLLFTIADANPLRDALSS